MRSTPKVIIVGGSLVGPAAELFLRRKGFRDVTTLEANPKPFSQSGGVMGVRTQTLDLLADVGIPTASVTAINDPNVYAFDVNGTDVTLRGVSEFPGVVTSWDALHTHLADRVNIHHGHTVQGLADDAGRTYLLCSCGNQHDADVFIWADGRKSTGRTILDPGRTLAYNGYVVWRGLVEPPTPHPQGFHRYHDIRGGRLFSVTAPVVQTGKSYFEFSHNLLSSGWETLTGKRPEDHAYMLPGFVKRHPQVHDIIRRNAAGLPHGFEEIIDHAEISGIPVNDIDFPDHLIYPHQSGAVSVLIGDAAVPIRLQVGAGLNQGLMQAYEFCNALTASNPYDALQAWERMALGELGRWVELGRSRAHRNNLGWYMPVIKGRTTAPLTNAWAHPEWVIA